MADNESPTEDAAADNTPSDERETGGTTDPAPTVTPHVRLGGHQIGLSLELEP